MSGFQRAVKSQAKLRLCLAGQSGSGKTWTALALAEHLVPGGRVAVIDTERSSAALYADRFTFDTLCLESFAPADYVDAIELAEKEGYETIVIDSLSHAWMGKGGALEQVDKIAKREGKSNNFTAWRDVTPQHNRLVDSVLATNAHVIATLRSKTEYVMDKDEKGKTTIRKVGLEPIQRSGIEYEFTIVGDLDLQHQLTVTKSRAQVVPVGDVINLPGEKLAKTLASWLNNGAVPITKPAPSATPALAGPLPGVPPTELDKAFADYLVEMSDAPDQATLDRIAAGPEKPEKGTRKNELANETYKRRKRELLAGNGVSPS